MVPVTSEPTETDFERWEQIARLPNNAAFQSLLDEVLIQRDRYYTNFARGLAKSGRPVDQREVDYKRGFFDGAIYALKVLPPTRGKDLERQIERLMREESELA